MLVVLVVRRESSSLPAAAVAREERAHPHHYVMRPDVRVAVRSVSERSGKLGAEHRFLN